MNFLQSSFERRLFLYSFMSINNFLRGLTTFLGGMVEVDIIDDVARDLDLMFIHVNDPVRPVPWFYHHISQMINVKKGKTTW